MKSFPKIKKKIEITRFIPGKQYFGAEPEQESSPWVSHPAGRRSDHLISALAAVWEMAGVIFRREKNDLKLASSRQYKIASIPMKGNFCCL